MRVLRSEDVIGFPLFNKVTGKVLLSGERLMFLLAEVEPGGIIPEHSHPHEQMGFCLKGKAEFTVKEQTAVVETNTFYWLKPNEKHSVRIIGQEAAVFLDVFSPPRKDYLKKAKVNH